MIIKLDEHNFHNRLHLTLKKYLFVIFVSKELLIIEKYEIITNKFQVALTFDIKDFCDKDTLLNLTDNFFNQLDLPYLDWTFKDVYMLRPTANYFFELKLK